MERIIALCEEEEIDLLLIAGDLFHRQPLHGELREVNAMFATLSKTQVVLCVGNHDYMKKDSYYRSFTWTDCVHIILEEGMQCIWLKDLNTNVYGCSYHSRERIDKPYEGWKCCHKAKFEILMLHGGDEKHIPMKAEEIVGLGYDYVALGHIHKHMEIVPARVIYSGSLEPTDRNDLGQHGYIYGELEQKRDGFRKCQTVFVPFARREYIPLDIEVHPDMTGYELKKKVEKRIEENGVENIYKIRLIGFRNPETMFDASSLDVYGNMIECVDDTKPSFRMDLLKAQNKHNIIGKFIASFEGCDEDSLEYRAMCEGIEALMETRQ